MEINLDAAVAKKIIELTKECKIWQTTSIVLCLFLVICLPLILLAWSTVIKRTEDIRQQQEKQSAILEKVHRDKKQDQKISCLI